MTWIVFFCSCLGLFCLLLGVIIGLSFRSRGVSRRERRELADAAADRAGRLAAAQFRRMRQPELRERKTSTAAFLDPTPYGAVMFAAVAPELAHEWEPAHVASALAVASASGPHYPGVAAEDSCSGLAAADPITTGEIRAITEDMDAFMGRLLGEHPVPWPDGSGQ